MIVFRLFHIIAAALWVGGIVIMGVFIMPTLGTSGPAGGQVMQNLMARTSVTKYLPITGIITILAGFILFYLNSSIAPSFASSRMGMTYSIGGLAGLLALIIGGVMTGRSAGIIGKIGAEIAAAGGPPTAEQTARMTALRARMKAGSKISVALALIGVIAMSVARYV